MMTMEIISWKLANNYNESTEMKSQSDWKKERGREREQKKVCVFGSFKVHKMASSSSL